MSDLKRSAKMERILVLFLAMALPCFAAYDKRLVHVLEQLRSCSLALHEELPMVGGSAVGSAGAPHEFFLLLPYVQEESSEDDLRAMLQDRSPVVRIMAAACILKTGEEQLSLLLQPLSKDTAMVFVAPYGCGVLKMTVAEVVHEMKKHPRYFEGEAEPNQPPQPTTDSSAVSRG